MFRAVDPSEYLRRTNANDFTKSYFDKGCPPEIKRRNEVSIFEGPTATSVTAMI